MFDRVLNTPLLIRLTRGYHKVSRLKEKLGPKNLSSLMLWYSLMRISPILVDFFYQPKIKHLQHLPVQ